MPSLFGEWLLCADGTAHYHLDGRALCGSRAEVRGAASMTSYVNNRKQTLTPRCSACAATNENRWSRMGCAAPAGAPA